MSRSSVSFFLWIKYIVQFNFHNMHNIASQTRTDQRNYTGFRFERIRFERAPCQNEQISLHQTHWQQCWEVWLWQTLAYNEMFLLHVFTRCKTDISPKYLSGQPIPLFSASFCKLWQIKLQVGLPLFWVLSRKIISSGKQKTNLKLHVLIIFSNETCHGMACCFLWKDLKFISFVFWLL